MAGSESPRGRVLEIGPPPTRSPNRSEHTGEAEARLRLDLSGFSTESERAETVVERSFEQLREGNKEPGSSKATAKRKATVQLPNRLIGPLRARASEQGVVLGEVIVSAYVTHIDQVESELTAVDDEARVELGLPPVPRSRRRRPDDLGERPTQVGLYLPQSAYEVLDRTADELGVSRSYLVTKLLDLEFASHEGGS